MKRLLFLSVVISFLFSSCEFLFGTKDDPTVKEIFEEGKIDPNLVQNNVGYVPVLPVWQGFKSPTDVYVGYDEMVYIVDNDGLKILDLTGKLHRLIPIYKATKVIQDRRIHTYVIGKVVVEIAGQQRELSCVYHLKNTAASGNPVFVDTLIHPFCDDSRKNISFRNEDLSVEFTGMASNYDNTIMISRKGPVNNLSSSARPDNTVLFFNENGTNTGYAKGLSPLTPNLKSVIQPSSICGFTGPPQKIYGVSKSFDFLICQAASNQNIEFRVLWIKQYIDPDAGVVYVENPSLLNFDYSKADSFLYDAFKFSNPTDVCYAPDQSGYIFICDKSKHRFYQFTSNGFEGVTPPANSGISKNINVSFGKKGQSLFEFNEPEAIAYFRNVVYIADKGNNRIVRYILSTDLE